MINEREFNDWWNGDELVDEPFFVKDTPLYWAMQGWVAGCKAEREACAKRLDAVGCDHCAENIRLRGRELMGQRMNTRKLGTYATREEFLENEVRTLNHHIQSMIDTMKVMSMNKQDMSDEIERLKLEVETAAIRARGQ